MNNYIYLIQTREFKNMNQNIYKIGKTKQDNLTRINQYPKGSQLLLQQICHNCDILESLIIKEFKDKYIHRKDIGNEYFQGCYYEMIKDIHNKIITCMKDYKVEDIIKKNIKEIKKYKCKFCIKEYKHKQSKYNHEKLCKENNNNYK